MSAHQKALDRAKIALMSDKNSGFITTVCFNLKHVWDNSIPTACTNGLVIRYNIDFWNSLDKEEQLFLLLHETWHVAFMHMARLKERDPRKWNIAADYVINYMLVSLGYKMPKGGLYDAQYADMSTEQVYNLLPDDPKEDLPMSDLEDPGEDMDKTPEQVQAEIEDILVRAHLQSQITDRAPGMMPEEIQLYINGLMNPQLPWNRILSRYVARMTKSDWSWRRPNRRYFPDHYLPSQYSETLCDVAMAGDISGSVSDETFKQYLSEVYAVLNKEKPETLTFMQFDTTIKQVDVIEDLQDLMNVKLHGRGGTNINPVIQWVAQNKPSLMVILTDGHFDLEEPNPKVPIIWAISDNPNFSPPYGKVIHLPS